MIDFLFIIYLIHHSVLYLNTMMVLQDLVNRRFIIDITKKIMEAQQTNIKNRTGNQIHNKL